MYVLNMSLLYKIWIVFTLGHIMAKKIHSWPKKFYLIIFFCF